MLKLKNKKIAAFLLAMFGGLTGCTKNEPKQNNKIVNPDSTVLYLKATEYKPVPSSTKLEVPVATIAPSVLQTGNLKACNVSKIVNANNVNMRLDTNTKSLVLGQLNKGDKCTCVAEYKDWSLVLVGRMLCFIKSEFLDVDYIGDSLYSYVEDLDIVYATTGVNFRLSPEVNDYNKIMLIPKNSEIEVFGRTNNDWYLAKYNGCIGYVCSQYTKSLRSKIESTYPEIKDLKIQKIVSMKNNSFLLQKPNSSSSRIKNLEVYESAEVLAEVNRYYLVKVGQEVGYVLKDEVKSLGDPCIIIDLSEQKFKLYQNNEIILCTLVSTGKSSSPTPIGLYKIECKTPGCYLIGPDYEVWVNYWMQISGNIGIHDIENRKMGTPKSHGCISMALKDASFTYDHCHVGTKVNIQR